MIMETSVSIAIMNLMVHYIFEFVLSIVFVVFCLQNKRKSAFFSLLATIIIFLVKSYGFSSYHENEDLLFISFSARSSNSDQIHSIQELLKKQPDIMAIQEVVDPLALKYAIKNTDYNLFFSANKASVIVSKFSAVKSEFIGNIQKVKIKSLGGLIVYNIHAPKFIRNIKNYNTLFSALISDIESYPLSQPVMVMGDFNSVETNYWRQVLQNDLMFTGALTHIGKGFINTFPSKHRIYGGVIPFISIDEIYHRGINGMSGEVLSDYLGSDHYPVMLKVKL